MRPLRFGGLQRTAPVPQADTVAQQAVAGQPPEPQTKPAKESAAPAEAEDVAIVESEEPLTESNFQAAWKSFWEDTDAQRSSKQKALRSLPIVLDIPQQAITITVGSTILEDAVTEMREDLMRYLRQKLGKPQLSINTTMQEAAVERRPYTNQEKLQHLLEKQPKLQDLLDRLDLDPDL